MQRAVARQHLGDARVRFARFADRRQELAVLQLDAVDRDVETDEVTAALLLERSLVQREPRAGSRPSSSSGSGESLTLGM